MLGATSIITLVRGSGPIFIGDEVWRGLSLTAQVLTVLVTLPVVLYLARTWVEYLMLPIGRIVPFRKIAVQLNDADAHALFDFLNGPLEKFVFRSRANGVCQFTPFVAHAILSRVRIRLDVLGFGGGPERDLLQKIHAAIVDGMSNDSRRWVRRLQYRPHQ